MVNDPFITEIREERRWLRKALGIFSYHTLQQAKYENVRGNKWKVSDTANALHLSIGYISESIKLAKFSVKIDFTQVTREKALDMIKYYTNMDIPYD